MKKKEFNKWKEISKNGKVRFILQYGILYQGIPLGLVIVFVQAIRDEGIVVVFNDWISVASCIMIGIIYGVLLGTIYGTVQWSVNRKKWLK
ncbi:MAG: hypothetical protein N4A57_15765 [Anaeromicrobium sp.]|jgi:hypothetical protein|uniref:hypothetical protein n=1 Tax=Anaeromicrobium sp. TaxID=1929132 RepID=UPI0025E53DA0|nr:hypothetical protein [Anaeromicrobium sp.]MCT4595705.1 hypothetical protein [Anaeromicrobium sp.]